jgi:HD-like signal output (HDOD) protein
MPEGPTVRASPSDAEYAQAMGLEPAALQAREEAPSTAEAQACEVLRPYLAASPTVPGAFPAVALEILELVRTPDVDLAQLARTIRADGALAGGVLALANSAVHRAVRRIDTIQEAVSRLGLSEVARLTAAISMRSLYGADAGGARGPFQAAWQQLSLHAVTVARCTSELARQGLCPTPGVEQTFLAGLLHDVGLAGALRAVCELVSYRKLPALPEPVLGRVLRRVHVETGVALHRSWKLGPLIHLVRLVSAQDLLSRAPAAHPRAAAETAESARALGLEAGRVKALAAELQAAQAWVAMVLPG